MQIATNSLITPGKKEVAYVNIYPFTFESSIEYIQNKPSNILDKLIYDLKWMESKDPNISKLPITDYPSLRTLQSIVSLSKNESIYLTTKCPYCGTENVIKKKLTDFNYNELPIEATNELPLLLGGRELTIRISSISDFFEIARRYSSIKYTGKIELLLLLSVIKEYHDNPNEVQSLIFNSSDEDLTTLYSLYQILFQRIDLMEVECIKCFGDSGPYSVDISDLDLDPLRSISQNFPINRNKETLKSLSKHG